MRNFPQERPLIFVTQWIRHSMINQFSMQVEYETEFQWMPTTKLSELMRRIQAKFTQELPVYGSELDKGIQALDNYQRQVESLRTKPQGTQPPPLPCISLESTLNTFEYQ
jgi:hypothetical protein